MIIIGKYTVFIIPSVQVYAFIVPYIRDLVCWLDKMCFYDVFLSNEGELLDTHWSSWVLSCFLGCMYSVNAGSGDTFSVSEVGTYMLIKISGKLQAAVLCLSQMRPTMTCWVHQSWCNQAEQDNTDLRGCRKAHAKYTLSIRIMEWSTPRLLLGTSHVVFFCSGGFNSVGGSQNSISREPKNVHFHRYTHFRVPFQSV